MIESVGPLLLAVGALWLTCVVGLAFVRAYRDERGDRSYHPHRRAMRTLARSHAERRAL